MLGKTKMDGAQNAGAKLGAKNNKWYRRVTRVQLLVFAAMYLILGMYFAFVTTEYANHPGFAATIEAHRNMDQIFAVIYFALFITCCGLFGSLRKGKQISVLYYVVMAAAAVLPFVYCAMSDSYIVETMRDNLVEKYPEVIVDGKGDAGWITFWTGIEFGAWANGGEITHESQVIVDYLKNIGVEAGAEVEIAKFDLGGLLAQLKNEMYSWNKFELYAIINAVLSVAFGVCTAIMIPLKKIKLFKK